jgi:photosystem II stability/assembly factor-like uncharacterized protein
MSWSGANKGLSSNVTGLEIDPVTPSKLYVIAGDSLFRSVDSGENWTALNAGLPSRALKVLTVDPLTPSTLYAVGINGGILKSADAGENWTPSKGPAGTVGFADSVLSLAIDPGNSSTIYAGSFAAATGVRGGVGRGSIGKSSNGGLTWKYVNAGIPANAFVRSLSIDPSASSTIYGSYSDSGRWGIIKSTDAGDTWVVINNGLPSGNGNFVGSPVMIDPRAPTTLYAGYILFPTEFGGIVKSTDGGETWNAADTGRNTVEISALSIDPVDNTLYAAAGAHGLFKSMDNGGHWDELVDFQIPPSPYFPPGVTFVRSLRIDPVRPNTLFALIGRSNGCVFSDSLLFKSTDAGAFWKSVSPPSSGCLFDPPSPLVIDPTDGETLYVAGNYSEGPVLVKTSNGGADWNYLDVPSDRAIATLVIDGTNHAILYAGSSAGVFKSSDGGASWVATSLDLGVNTLVVDPVNSNVIYAATRGSYPSMPGFSGLFKTIDAGENWSPINNGLSPLADTRSPITALVIDPADPRILYAGTAGYGVFKSTDHGSNWEPFNDGLTNLDVRHLVLSPDNLYAGTKNGVFALRIS